jgi:hypothetical protein
MVPTVVDRVLTVPERVLTVLVREVRPVLIFPTVVESDPTAVFTFPTVVESDPTAVLIDPTVVERVFTVPVRVVSPDDIELTVVVREPRLEVMPETELVREVSDDWMAAMPDVMPVMFLLRPLTVVVSEETLEARPLRFVTFLPSPVRLDWIPVTAVCSVATLVVRVPRLVVMVPRLVVSAAMAVFCVVWTADVARAPLKSKDPTADAENPEVLLAPVAPTRYVPVAAATGSVTLKVYTYRPPGLGETRVPVPREVVVVAPGARYHPVMVAGPEE